MAAPQRISQRDVAARAEVHFTTVSLALRNSPALPLATRERIQRIALEMGYRPDPMLTALQAYRKKGRSSPPASVIAWISTDKRATELFTSNHVCNYHRGAVLRCEELGYRLEEFRLSEVSANRLDHILQTRGIQGLLLPPQNRNRAHFNFAWQNYSAVTFGYSLSRPRLHVVTNAQYAAVRMAMRQLWSRGYRRIGYVTTHNSDERTDQHFTAGYLSTEMRFAGTQRPIPPLVLGDDSAASQYRAFRAWYREHAPEAILSLYGRIHEFMREAGVSFDECGFALLHLQKPHREASIAGIDQNDAIIGTSAVDFLVAMLHRNERGLPETPLRLLVEGRWVEGDTIRARAGRKRGAVPAALV